MWCRVSIRSTQRHLAAVSAGGINSQATCLSNSCTARPALELEKPVQSKQQAFNYVYQKGIVFPPIKIQSVKQCSSVSGFSGNFCNRKIFFNHFPINPIANWTYGQNIGNPAILPLNNTSKTMISYHITDIKSS